MAEDETSSGRFAVRRSSFYSEVKVEQTVEKQEQVQARQCKVYLYSSAGGAGGGRRHRAQLLTFALHQQGGAPTSGHQFTPILGLTLAKNHTSPSLYRNNSFRTRNGATKPTSTRISLPTWPDEQHWVFPITESSDGRRNRRILTANGGLKGNLRVSTSSN